jgi:hypothetical protein
MNYWWWFKNIVHIETLFYVIVVVLIIYFLITKKDDKSRSFFDLISEGQKFKKRFKSGKKKGVALDTSEEKCRKIFEKIYNCKFEKIRPDWLKNPETQRNLELDGYNAEIKTPLGKGLAFEYDGQQHHDYSPHFHKSYQDFVKQRQRDQFKDKTCRKLGILLIRIPYYTPKFDFENEIRNRIQLELLKCSKIRK